MASEFFRSTWLLGLALSLAVGCGAPSKTVQPPYTVFRSPNLVKSPPRRVLLLPIEKVTKVGEFADRWYATLARELRATKRFEVVVTKSDVPCVRQCLTLLQRGQYDEQALAAVRDHFRVEGVIFVNVTDYYPYWPPRMAATLNLVETTQGETIAAVDGNWDAANDDVRQIAHRYAPRVTASHTLNDPDLLLVSPDYFGKFVANQLAETLCRLMRDDQRQKPKTPADVARLPEQEPPVEEIPPPAPEQDAIKSAMISSDLSRRNGRR